MHGGKAELALGILTLFLAGCASAVSVPEGVAQVSVAELHSNPGQWDGKRVQVTGLVIAEFENLGLYAGWQDYCSDAVRPRALYVQWEQGSQMPQSRQRRMATVRGVFRNWIGAPRIIDGKTYSMVSTGAPGPGPLENVEIVRWHGAQLPECKR